MIQLARRHWPLPLSSWSRHYFVSLNEPPRVVSFGSPEVVLKKVWDGMKHGKHFYEFGPFRIEESPSERWKDWRS
jgi:hypothetical protein